MESEDTIIVRNMSKICEGRNNTKGKRMCFRAWDHSVLLSGIPSAHPALRVILRPFLAHGGRTLGRENLHFEQSPNQ